MSLDRGLSLVVSLIVVSRVVEFLNTEFGCGVRGPDSS